MISPFSEVTRRLLLFIFFLKFSRQFNTVPSRPYLFALSTLFFQIRSLAYVYIQLFLLLIRLSVSCTSISKYVNSHRLHHIMSTPDCFQCFRDLIIFLIFTLSYVCDCIFRTSLYLVFLCYNIDCVSRYNLIFWCRKIVQFLYSDQYLTLATGLWPAPQVSDLLSLF